MSGTLGIIRGHSRRAFLIGASATVSIFAIHALWKFVIFLY